MSYNFINEASSIAVSSLCAYDTARAYETDFNTNGDVDGWEYFDGIHTYGVWDGFLFGTLYGSYALVGRPDVFAPVSAKTHYTVKITMKINPFEFQSSRILPTVGRIMWVTESYPVWHSDKQMDFTIYADNLWHTYVLNMSAEQWWIGDIGNLRIYPVYEDGRDGDEFFIRTIQIVSVDTYNCFKPVCSYYNNYSHPCGGIGSRGYCQSSSTGAEEYTIEAGINDELIVDINDYGDEIVRLDEVSGVTGEEVSKIIAKSISKVNVGGYAETEVNYTEAGKFKIYSGTYISDSTAVIKNSNAAVTLGFFDSDGNDLSSKDTGSTPADKFKPSSSFKIKTFQLISLFTDNNVSLRFNPALYNVEGGRMDWFEGGMGSPEISGDDPNTSTKTKTIRHPFIIDNANKTIIDFCHPFNASGRIKKINLMCTLDQGYEVQPVVGLYRPAPAENFGGRLEATGCKVKIFRPKRDGTLKTITSIDIPNRDYSGGKLLSITQESTLIDCDIWVNKGDLIGVYNANMHVGKSITGAEVDALYYHVDGEATGEFDPGKLYGDGIGGLLVYARSDETQKRLSIDIDFGNRLNVEEVNVIGTPEVSNLEFNVARCLDINWTADLFGGTHWSAHTNLRYSIQFRGGQDLMFPHTNEYYGLNCLNDGILTPTDALVADSFTVNVTNENTDAAAPGAPFPPTPGITVTNARYFFCNGDGEWLGVYTNKGRDARGAWIEQFKTDPIAFTLLFPYGTTKKIYKSRVYFKDRNNFRSFALSVSYNLNDILGDADVPNFYLIEEYTAVTVNDRRIEKDGPGYDQIEHYLFTNPCNGHEDIIFTGERIDLGDGKVAYPGDIADYEGYIQSVNTGWNVLTHEFDPIECKGFRFYCDYHESTKINEMELYCMVEDVGSSMIGSLNIIHSHYNDLWWNSTLTENADGSVTAFIGDTSRYFSIDIEPIGTMNLNNIRFDIKEDAVFVGTKGCELQLLPIHSKLGATNQGQSIDIKNIYGDGFDLYVDIAKDTEYDEGLVFYNRLNNAAAIANPEVGPDARYKKEEDYRLVNYNKNCAINNECYGLRNLIDGKKAYYSYLNELIYQEFGTLSSDVSIDFTNIPAVSMTVVNVPVLSRSRYWKLGWFCGDHPSMNVIEVKLFYEGEELEATFYHDKNLEYEAGPISDTAPHLNNNSPLGSYYQLKGDHHIGFDLGSSKAIDKIVMFHGSLADYNETYCGIDTYTKLCMTVKDGDIVDYSYNERSFTIVGTGIYPDISYWGSNTAVRFSGGYDNYISVPASSDWTFPGTVYDDANTFPPFNEACTVDFFVKFDSLPTTGGYATLIRNWADVPDTRYGGVPYPPPEKYSNAVIQGLNPQPEANWAIFVRHMDNVTSAVKLGVGGSFTSSEPGGYDHYPYDGEFSVARSFSNSITPMYTQVNLPSAKTVNRYGVYAYTLTSSPVLRDFTLQAYVTASGTWLDLHSVTGFTPSSSYNMNYYDFTNPYPACTSYRLLITANNGNPDLTIINELELYAVEGNDDICQLEFWAQSTTPPGWDDAGYRWHRNVWPYALEVDVSYNISMSRQSFEWSQANSTEPYNKLKCYVNGVEADISGIGQERPGLGTYPGPLKIGENIDGVMTDVRVSKDLIRHDYTPALWHPKEHLYAMSLYVSDDNIIYGKYCDIDTRFDNSYHYYDSNNKYSEYYYSYFAIDLGRRYDLDLIRGYGAADRFGLSFYGENSELIDYSNDETDDVELVTWTTRDSWANNVTLWAGELTANGVWTSDGSYCAVSKVFTPVNCTGLTKENGMLVIDIKCGSYSQYIDYTRGSQIEITSSATSDVQEWGHELIRSELEFLASGEYHTYYFPLKHFHTTGGELDVSQIDYIRFYAYGTNSQYSIKLYWKNAKIVWSVPDALEVVNDVRWLRISLYNGDDVERVIRKLGVYPDISTKIGPGGGVYNHEWDSLGTAITSYGSEENIAFNTTVSGNYFGIQYTGKAVNGVIPETTDSSYATLDDVWCSETEINPWITIDLGEVYEIYRIKIYHGYDGENTDYLITDYTVRTSTDGQSFTTRFTITNNSSFERIHDLPAALSVRYVKIDITGYDSKSVYLRTDYLGGTAAFNGATLREIEVYEFYSFASINSEEYPVICMNLADQFYLESHSITGFDAEDSSSDWDNNDYNFCYSDAVLDNPSKVDFREWQDVPAYDQWAVVRMNTATNYNNGPHYLKHVRIESTTGKNPCEYPWWWSSNVSTLSRDYDYHVTNSVSAIRIDYPATDVSETISFIEGDNFGIDEQAAFRDGFNFKIRIDDIDNLDMSYGYFYFGGYDNTTSYNPVVHKWNLSTLSGVLDTGWNNLFLRFKATDELDYTVPTDESLPDVRIPSTITFGTLGMVFRGVGNPLTMHLDGFYIRRNHFNDYVAYGNGLYLTGEDYLVCPIGEFDLALGTVELWLRPDWDDYNYDFYQTLKNRAIFQFNNNANDVFGLMNTYTGLEVYSGNLTDGINVFTLTDLGIDILDITFHLGIVFSNDGTQISNDGSTIRVYLNNILIAKSNVTWNIYDNKHFQFVLGGQGPLALKEGGWITTSSMDAAVNNLKIYNYCKTDFEKSMLNREDAADDLTKPSNLIEISKNNLTYYKVGDAALPFKFETVPYDTVTSVYVRTDVPSLLDGKEKRTAGLLVYWDMAI